MTAVLPDIRRLLPHGHGLFTFWIGSVLVGLELFGRSGAAMDYHDVLAVIVLISVFSLAVVRHQKDPHPWMCWLERITDRLSRRVVRLRHEFGFDFRGDPPLPRKLPRAIPAAFLFAIAIGSSFATGWWFRPEGWRSFVAFVPYVLYLVVISLVWAGLITAIVVGAMLPLRLFDGFIDGLAVGSKPAIAAVYIISLLFLSLSLPPAIPLAFAGLLLLGSATAYSIRGATGPGVVWKSPDSKVASVIPIHHLFALGVGLGIVVTVVLIIAACGGTLLLRPDWSGSMPLTAMVGAFAAWFIPGVAGVLGTMVWHMYRSDPARRTPPTLHLANVVATRDLIRLRTIANRWGWRMTNAPSKPEKESVSIRLVPAELSEAREFDPGWPLNVCLEDLSAEVVKDRLVRRDEIQLRRAGFRGLKKLFKRAGLQKGSGGAGVLFAPHWWFIEGLDREEEPVKIFM